MLKIYILLLFYFVDLATFATMFGCGNSVNNLNQSNGDVLHNAVDVVLLTLFSKVENFNPIHYEILKSLFLQSKDRLLYCLLAMINRCHFKLRLSSPVKLFALVLCPVEAREK